MFLKIQIIRLDRFLSQLQSPVQKLKCPYGMIRRRAVRDRETERGYLISSRLTSMKMLPVEEATGGRERRLISFYFLLEAKQHYFQCCCCYAYLRCCSLFNARQQ